MKYSLMLISLFITFLSFSQDDVKRNVYKGNIFYHDSEFEDAAYYYKKAVDESGFNFKANYNLANTQFRLEEFDKAIETYEKIAEYTNTNTKKAKIYHNIGNAQMYALNKKDDKESYKVGNQVQRIDDAIEAYKKALRANPNDEETRYNLAYALLIKKRLDEQQKQNEKNKKESDEKNDSDDKKNGDKSDSDKKDGDKSDSDDKKDGDKSEEDKKEEGDKEKEGDKSDQDKESDQDSDKKDDKDGEGKPKNQKPQQQKISKSQAKRILEAAQKAEKDIQDKLNKQKVIVGKKGKASTKKDW